MELKRDEIIKALECCSSSDDASACESGCPYWGGDYDTCPCIEEPSFIIKNAHSLIKELTEENERLQYEIENGVVVCHDCHTKYADKIEQAKADTVRQMQTEIEARCIKGGIYPAFVKNVVNQVAEELANSSKQ